VRSGDPRATRPLRQRGRRSAAGVRAWRTIRRLLTGFATLGTLRSAPRSAKRSGLRPGSRCDHGPAVAVAIPIAAIATAAVTAIAREPSA